MESPARIKIVGIECKFAINVPSQINTFDDAVFIKEKLHLSNGEYRTRLTMRENIERDFYITRSGYQNHKDKKEYELVSRLQKYTCTQRQMPERIARALGTGFNNLSLRRLARSPFLYGTDISITALEKHKYKTRWPDAVSENTVAVLDIETDVIHGTGDILSLSITMKDKCLLVINKAFIKGVNDPETQIQNAMVKYLGKYKESRNIKLDIFIEDTPGKVVVRAMQVAHEWQPDWMVVWNINFDIKEMFKALDKENINIARTFCAPEVPNQYKFAEYIEGPSQKKTASDKFMSLNPWERWHTFNVPSSFYWICAMSTYAFIRKAAGQEPSYSLDAILHKELGERKLNFDVADGYTKLEWHQFMQANYKIEYLIYNLFDCIGVELLDESISDLRLTLPELIGVSDYANFNSTPKQLADDLHFVYQQEEPPAIIASTSDQMFDENDESVVSMDGWIITLATHLNTPDGMCATEDFPDLKSLIYGWVADLDVKSAYPYGQIIANISRETTILELCEIVGVEDIDRRIIGLNLTAGHTNSVEFMTRAFKAPQMKTLLDSFLEDFPM
jgi:hypothetical protein